MDMSKVRSEEWNGFQIRFVEKAAGDWWAIAKDVSEALGYKHTPHMLRLIEDEDKITVRLTDGIKRGNPNVIIVSEFGIYDAVFGSKREEAKDFKKWVKQMLKSLRQQTGLEGFQIFRMLDKDHQREAMQKLKANLAEPARIDFIKANTIANKAVSSMYGHPKMLKKELMTPDMLVKRQQVLDDTVDLMSVAERFGLGISVSETVYQKYVN